MRHFKHYILIALVLVLPMLCSCRQELCYNHYPAMDLSFTWEQEWERDYGMAHESNWDSDFYGFGYHELKPVLPEWVTLVKYSDDQNPSEKYFTPKGGQLILDGEKNRSFLLYNGDTEYIVLSDMASLPDARASATSRSRSSIANVEERHPNARTTNPPDLLYSAFIKEVPSVAVHELKPLAVKMQPLVYTYVIRYEFEAGLEYVTLARGALGGMAESVYLRDGVTSDETAIILFDCDITDYGCETHVRSFGIPGFPDEYYGRAASETKDRPFTLNLEVKLKNGKTVEFNYDISDQMEKQPRGGVITVKGLRIEEEQGYVSSGFTVDVEGWGDKVEIELPVSAQ